MWHDYQNLKHGIQMNTMWQKSEEVLEGGVGVKSPPKKHDIIFEQPLTRVYIISVFSFFVSG